MVATHAMTAEHFYGYTIKYYTILYYSVQYYTAWVAIVATAAMTAGHFV